MKKFPLINLSAAVCLVFTFVSCKKVDQVVPVTYAPITINKTPRVIKPKTVVVLGSSTAAGFGASVKDSSWVNRLNSNLQQNNQGKVINLSVPGYTTYDIMPTGFVPPALRNTPKINNNITKALSYSPDIIIISLPSNDIAWAFTDKEILSNFKALTGMLDSLNVPYLLTGTQPRNFPSNDVRYRLKTLNQLLVMKYTWHVDDFFEQMNDGTYNLRSEINSGDGIHPNNKGHKLIYETFLKNKWFQRLLNL